jgi:hypothetical protein
VVSAAAGEVATGENLVEGGGDGKGVGGDAGSRNAGTGESAGGATVPEGFGFAYGAPCTE